VVFFFFFGLTNRDGSSGAGEEHAAKSTRRNKHSNLRLRAGGEEFCWSAGSRRGEDARKDVFLRK